MFHSQLLRLASSDPLPSQIQDDTQPLPQLVGNEDEYEIEKILDEKTVRGRGSPRKKFLVKWTGYAKPTWEPEDALKDTVALDAWEAETVRTDRQQGRELRTRPRRRGGG